MWALGYCGTSRINVLNTHQALYGVQMLAYLWCVQTRVKDRFCLRGAYSQIGGKRQVCTAWFGSFKMLPLAW